MIITAVDKPMFPNCDVIICEDECGNRIWISSRCFPYKPKLNEQFEWITLLKGFRLEPLNSDWTI